MASRACTARSEHAVGGVLRDGANRSRISSHLYPALHISASALLMPRIKRKQKQVCDCLDCADDLTAVIAAAPEAAAVPQESLACVLLSCTPNVHDQSLLQLPALDLAARSGGCGLLSLRDARMGEHEPVLQDFWHCKQFCAYK